MLDLDKDIDSGLMPGPKNPPPISDQNIRVPYPISHLILKMYSHTNLNLNIPETCWVSIVHIVSSHRKDKKIR